MPAAKSLHWNHTSFKSLSSYETTSPTCINRIEDARVDACTFIMALTCGNNRPDCTLYQQGKHCGKYQADSDIAGIGVRTKTSPALHREILTRFRTGNRSICGDESYQPVYGICLSSSGPATRIRRQCHRWLGIP